MVVDVVETLGLAGVLFIFVCVVIIAWNLLGVAGGFIVCIFGALALQWFMEQPQ